MVTFLVIAWATCVNVKHGMITFSPSSSRNTELTMIALDFYIFHKIVVGGHSIPHISDSFYLKMHTSSSLSLCLRRCHLVVQCSHIFQWPHPHNFESFLDIFWRQMPSLILLPSICKIYLFHVQTSMCQFKRMHHAWIATLILLKQDKLRGCKACEVCER